MTELVNLAMDKQNIIFMIAWTEKQVADDMWLQIWEWAAMQQTIKPDPTIPN